MSWPAPLRKKWLRTGYTWNLGPSTWVSCLGPTRHGLGNIRSCQKASLPFRTDKTCLQIELLDLRWAQKPPLQWNLSFLFYMTAKESERMRNWETTVGSRTGTDQASDSPILPINWITSVPHVTMLAMWMLLVLPLDQLPVLDVWRGARWRLRCGLCKHWQVPISAQLVQFYAEISRSEGFWKRFIKVTTYIHHISTYSACFDEIHPKRSQFSSTELPVRCATFYRILPHVNIWITAEEPELLAGTFRPTWAMALTVTHMIYTAGTARNG